jgi:hypothetical protein
MLGMIAATPVRRCPSTIPTDQRLQRGAAVRHGRHVGLVARAAGGQVALWRVWFREPERATDVELTHWSDRMMFSALADRLVIDVSKLLTVPAERQVVLGQVRPGLLAEVERAAERARQTQRVSARWGRDREHRRDACQPGAGRF